MKVVTKKFQQFFFQQVTNGIERFSHIVKLFCNESLMLIRDFLL